MLKSNDSKADLTCKFPFIISSSNYSDFILLTINEPFSLKILALTLN